MSNVEKILAQMRANGTNVRFADREKVCEHYVGPARNRGGSHRLYKTSWMGDPRVSIQNDRGTAKPYQVRQVLHAVDKLRTEGLDDER